MSVTDPGMEPIDAQVDERFVAFDRTCDAGPVHQALDEVEAAERALPPDGADARRRSVALWLGFLAALDRRLDATWTPSGAPARGVAPPPTDGPVQGSGEVDPATIADAAERARYVAALEMNKAARKAFTAQLQLHRIDERAVDGLARAVDARWGGDAMREEVAALLVAAPLTATRQQALRRRLLPAAAERGGS